MICFGSEIIIQQFQPNSNRINNTHNESDWAPTQDKTELEASSHFIPCTGPGAILTGVFSSSYPMKDIPGGPAAKTPHAGGPGSCLVGELDPTHCEYELAC